MYKLIPIFLFAFGFAETVEVYYKTDTPIAGFQFHETGVDVIGAGGGAAEAAGFTIGTGNNTVVGFSVEGYTIPSGNDILLVLDVDGKTEDACLTDLVISDSDGQALDATFEDCNSINISGSGLVRLDKFSFSKGTWDGDACNMAVNSFHVTKSGTVLYNTDTPISGFQFNVDGANALSADGGNSEAAGFMISSSSTFVLGFSLTGTTFDGKGKLIQIEYPADKTARDNDAAVAPFDCASAVASFGCDFMWGDSRISDSCPETCGYHGLSTICIESIIVSDPDGEAIDFHSGECWIP